MSSSDEYKDLLNILSKSMFSLCFIWIFGLYIVEQVGSVVQFVVLQNCDCVLESDVVGLANEGGCSVVVYTVVVRSDAEIVFLNIERNISRILFIGILDSFRYCTVGCVCIYSSKPV